MDATERQAEITRLTNKVDAYDQAIERALKAVETTQAGFTRKMAEIDKLERLRDRTARRLRFLKGGRSGISAREIQLKE